MKKFFLMLFILLIPLVAKAECSTEETSRLKTLASKISVTYDYVEDKNGIVFSTTFHNVYSDLKIIDNRNEKSYSTNDQFGDITIKNLVFPGTYSVSIVSKSKNCNNEKITTKYYTIPYYNPYYTDPLCIGNETKKVCQKWANTTSLTYSDFKKSFEKKEEEQQVIEKEEESKYNLIMDLFVKYYYILFGSIIIVSLTIIIIINRKNSFDFRT